MPLARKPDESWLDALLRAAEDADCHKYPDDIAEDYDTAVDEGMSSEEAARYLYFEMGLAPGDSEDFFVEGRDEDDERGSVDED